MAGFLEWQTWPYLAPCLCVQTPVSVYQKHKKGTNFLPGLLPPSLSLSLSLWKCFLSRDILLTWLISKHNSCFVGCRLYKLKAGKPGKFLPSVLPNGGDDLYFSRALHPRCHFQIFPALQGHTPASFLAPPQAGEGSQDVIPYTQPCLYIAYAGNTIGSDRVSRHKRRLTDSNWRPGEGSTESAAKNVSRTFLGDLTMAWRGLVNLQTFPLAVAAAQRSRTPVPAWCF